MPQKKSFADAMFAELAAVSRASKQPLTQAQIGAGVRSIVSKPKDGPSIARKRHRFDAPIAPSRGALVASPEGTLTDQAARLVGRLTGDSRQSHRIAGKLGTVSDFINPASWATNFGHSARQLYEAPSVQNGIDTALNALDVIPGVGKGVGALAGMGLPILKKGAKALRRAATLEDFAPGNIGSIRDHDNWSILTAENPMGKQASPEANAKAMAALKADLDADGIQYIDGGVGKYGNHENVITALNIKEGRARHYGNKYKQDSVLTNKGLIYHDGRVTPAKGVNTFDEAPEDFYTELPNGSKFAVDLDWDNEIPAPGSVVPDTVYHGTNADEFDAFNPGATYFTNKPDWASGFGGKRTVEAKLDIRNPYEMDGTQGGRHFDWDEEDIADFRKDGHDGVVIRHPDGDVYTTFSPEQAQIIKAPKPGALATAASPAEVPIGALSSNRLRGADVDNMISTRRPSAANYGTQGNPDEELLIQSGAALRQTPKAFEANMGMMAEEPFMQGFKGSADEIYDESTRRGADNLKYIVQELMDPDLVGKARPWYETANRISREAAERAGIPDRAAYGVAAVTSPQKPWDINVANMERLIDMHGDRFSNSPADVEEGLRWVRNRLENPKTAGAVAGEGEDWARRVMETPYDELTDQFDRYGRVVLTDAIRHDPMVPRILPDGTREGDYGKITWGSGSEIGKALNILDDTSMANISAQMEGGGKVPSFFNNISAPNSKADIATIDTHSAGALSLFPGGGNDPIVYRSMGLGGTPAKPAAKSSALTGSKGFYGPAVDMHALAGRELGMLPREVQSATWEGVRNLWGQSGKTPALKKAIADAWNNAPNPDAARQNIRGLLGR